MTPSIRSADFTKAFEQCPLKEYMPTKDDVPTIDEAHMHEAKR